MSIKVIRSRVRVEGRVGWAKSRGSQLKVGGGGVVVAKLT